MRVLWQCPTGADAVLVLAHGAGAGMAHRNLQALADAFEAERLATLRFDFPFIEAGRRRVDPPAVAIATIASAVADAATRASLRVWLGGHSFGGRMASHAVLDGVPAAGLILAAFPLHAAGKPGVARAAHLDRVRQPMLFLSGTRDALARRDLLELVVATLPRAELHWLETADHSYRTLRRSRASSESVFGEIARVTRGFIDRVTLSARPAPPAVTR